MEGDSVTSILSMNASNSSIDQLINATPKQIISNPVVVVNADSTITNNNFVLSSSEISVSTEITLPWKDMQEVGKWETPYLLILKLMNYIHLKQK